MAKNALHRLFVLGILLSVLFSLTALGLTIAATGLVQWTNTATFNEGLWKYCVRLIGLEQCQKYDSADCNAPFQATRAFSICGIMFCAFASIMGTILLAKQILVPKWKWIWVGLCCFAFVTTLVCWVCWNIRNEDPACYSRSSYGSSYILQVVASGMAFGACMFAFFTSFLQTAKRAPKYAPLQTDSANPSTIIEADEPVYEPVPVEPSSAYTTPIGKVASVIRRPMARVSQPTEAIYPEFPHPAMATNLGPREISYPEMYYPEMPYPVVPAGEQPIYSEVPMHVLSDVDIPVSNVY